ncbi:glutaredoxin family protein [Bacillus sp. CGMCC 1.16607]|uniref:glutaredoxin family protein n=1 Tax=Bacillus sp. CGMCC 1.16607 TaxID=3351842 RepID=UPI003624CC48
MPTLIFYTRQKCSLCDKAKVVIEELHQEMEFEWIEKDIDESDELTEKYGLMIPVVEIDGEEVEYGHINKFIISKRLQESI